MVKLSIAVAALVAVSLAGTRLQAQSEQFASIDETPIVQDVQAQDVQTPAAVQMPDVQAPAESPVAAAPVTATGPTIDAASISPRLHSDAARTTHSMRRPSRGSGVGLMIFGGAALVTGLIIGDDAGTVIAVGGALVGLYGLYVYLGRPTGMEHGQAAQNTRIGLGYKLNTN
jgi:hypothetical protein